MEDASQVEAIIFAILLSCATTFFALRAGFFRFPLGSWPSLVSFRQLLGGFLIYFLISFLISPLLYLAFVYFVTGKGLSGIKQLPTELKGWLECGALLLLFLALLFYSLSIKRETLRSIFWGKATPKFATAIKKWFMGLLCLGIGYPVVIFISLIVELLAKWIWGKSGVEQVAVKQLLLTKEYPILFGVMIFFVVVIVPCIEEFLFRGLLQSWLRRHLGKFGAISLTAFIFALAHFATSQGSGNFELIVTLFALSSYMGFIFEREQSLWASIGVHMSFNAFSVIFISISDK